MSEGRRGQAAPAAEVLAKVGFDLASVGEVFAQWRTLWLSSSLKQSATTTKAEETTTTATANRGTETGRTPAATGRTSCAADATSSRRNQAYEQFSKAIKTRLRLLSAESLRPNPFHAVWQALCATARLNCPQRCFCCCQS